MQTSLPLAFALVAVTALASVGARRLQAPHSILLVVVGIALAFVPGLPPVTLDPDLVLLKVSIREAEYWEAPGNTVKRYYGLAKAIATGDTDGLGENEKIKREG